MARPRAPRAVSSAASLLAAIVGCAVLAGTVVSGGAAQRGSDARRRPPAREPTVPLIHWREVGRWAHAIRSARVHTVPTLRARTIAQLHFETEDGFREVYLVLARHVTDKGKTWIKIALPMKPNGTTGWVLRGALGPIRIVRTWLIIDRTRLRAQFFDHGRLLWKGPVGIGKASTPTPAGLFWVREQFELPDQPFYGPYAFGTSAYANISDWPGGGVVGLHGTSLPQLVPGHPSHGCIRLHNDDILWLAYHMPNGTPIAIIN